PAGAEAGGGGRKAPRAVTPSTCAATASRPRGPGQRRRVGGFPHPPPSRKRGDPAPARGMPRPANLCVAAAAAGGPYRQETAMESSPYLAGTFTYAHDSARRGEVRPRYWPADQQGPAASAGLRGAVSSIRASGSTAHAVVSQQQGTAVNDAVAMSTGLCQR